MLNLDYIITFISGILAAFLSGYLVSIIELQKQEKQKFLTVLQALFSELQENERVLRVGETFSLNLGNKTYKLLLTYLNDSTLAGSLSSGNLTSFSDHKLLSSLVLIERKIRLHNLLIDQIFNELSNLMHNSTETSLFMWLHNNLIEKQKILSKDLKNILQALERYEKSVSQNFIIKYYNKFVTLLNVQRNI